ncbi:AAA family ATPase [Streptomyces sp. NBC_01373]|uniref:AAA family ATPase n=1 Tax=Streptomyces sp. NBC_01373 TaxID=2903843 RepID=UPI002253FB8E|nr:AAA family ATPase [Streptomyces sp. NBC_01373]MCX4700372.1 AAA family ATPase [Streptomyces sp. NBC_01373]
MRGVALITGGMASGKSTVAQAPAESLPRAAHVRGDVFRRMIVSGREEYEPGGGGGIGGEGEAQLRLRYRLSAATADAYAEAGFTAVVQDVVLGANLTAHVQLVRTRPLYVVVLAPSPETVTAREAGRAKTGYGAWTVEELDGALRAKTPRIGLWLDSSELAVEETVAKILAGRERARVV